VLLRFLISSLSTATRIIILNLYEASRQSFMFVGLIIIVDDTTNLTSWFLSSDDESKSFEGVELSKRDNGLLVSYKTGNDISSLHCCHYLDYCGA